MIQQINKEMEALIRGWGLPEYLKEQEGNIDFKFDNHGIVLAENEQSYGCYGESAKFCLYDLKDGKVLFIMDFFKMHPGMASIRTGSEKAIKLELLYVCDESLRKKGISSYYIEKLQNYAIDTGVKCICVEANPNAKYFRGGSKEHALEEQELKEFYLKKTTDKMPIMLV
ncbi:hypothetical protein ACQKF0_12640 [Bacillus wiedmannii]|uniref:hypothetical protein n=1 Tax=Bacillus wiedmannii TaxID=1890302 RepID=UPI003D005CE6